MLVFKRFCVDAWTGFVCLACNALQSALHEYSKFAAGSRNALHFRLFPRFPGFAFVPAFPGSRVFLVLRFPRLGSRFEFVRY